MKTRSTCPDCGRAVRYREYFPRIDGTYDGLFSFRKSLICRGCGRRLWWSYRDPWAWAVLIGGSVFAGLGSSIVGEAVQPSAWRAAARSAGSPCWWFGDAVEYGLIALWFVGLVVFLPWIGPYTRTKREDDDARFCWRCRFDMRDNPAGPCTECGAALGYDRACDVHRGDTMPRCPTEARRATR